MAPLLETIMAFISPLHPAAKDWPLSGALAPHLPAFIEKRRLGRYAICTTEHYLEPGYHTRLRGSRLGDEGARTRPITGVKREVATLSGIGLAIGVLEDAVIM